MTEISKLGEFGLIRHLTQSIEIHNKETLKGVGDDCAILEYKDKEVLVTTDLLLEGIHFDLTYVPLKHLGYKAVMVNLSDIYAMNGKPKQVTVSLGISKKFSVEDIEQLYAGMLLACEAHGVDLVGGDTCSSLTGLTISITAIGEGEKGKVVERSGAKENDLICVSGDLGAAYMGLQLLERERAVYMQQLRSHQQSGSKGPAPEFQPEWSGREYLLQRQLRPEARMDVVRHLAEKGIVPTAMMDVSDGLSSELIHICKASGVGCRVFEEKLPIDYQTAAAAEEFNLSVITAAMNGGEDYELLFTVPLELHALIEEVEDVHLIGHICKAEQGMNLVTREGQEFELKAQGFQAFKE